MLLLLVRQRILLRWRLCLRLRLLLDARLLPLLLLPPTFSRNIYMWQDSEAPRTLYFLALGSRARIIKIQSDEDIRL